MVSRLASLGYKLGLAGAIMRSVASSATPSHIMVLEPFLKRSFATTQVPGVPTGHHNEGSRHEPTLQVRVDTPRSRSECPSGRRPEADVKRAGSRRNQCGEVVAPRPHVQQRCACRSDGNERLVPSVASAGRGLAWAPAQAMRRFPPGRRLLSAGWLETPGRRAAESMAGSVHRGPTGRGRCPAGVRVSSETARRPRARSW
jgi:hypothetical protein